jgi:hypothetical protein
MQLGRFDSARVHTGGRKGVREATENGALAGYPVVMSR